MTTLGNYLAGKSVIKSEVVRRTGIRKARITELTLNNSTKLRADKLHLIALANKTNHNQIFEKVCGHLKSPINNK